MFISVAVLVGVQTTDTLMHRVRCVVRYLRGGLSHHGGVSGRGRLPREQRGRALHGALRPQRQGPRFTRRRVARDDHRDPRGAVSHVTSHDSISHNIA